jgi:Ser/Thr protein kinase RdoA (MazF antagonist)
MASPEDLLALVRDQFLPQASAVQHLSGERDLNFLVTVADSADRYVLKVSDASRTRSQLLGIGGGVPRHMCTVYCR